MPVEVPRVTDQGERKKLGLSAIHTFLASSLAFITDGPAVGAKGPRANGSGALLVTAAGNVIVVTAKHVLEDDVPPDGFSLGGQAVGVGAIAEPFVRYWSHPSADVAIALLTTAAAERVRHGAVSHTLVAGSQEVFDAEREDAYLCGFPTEYRAFEVDDRAKTISQHSVSVVYRTGVDGLDERQRYRVTWTEGVVETPHALQRLHGIEAGKPFKHKHPRGISGGPLWKTANLPLDQVWSAASAVKLIGIASTWNKEDTEFCVSSLLFGDWFRETIAQIDMLCGSSANQ